MTQTSTVDPQHSAEVRSMLLALLKVVSQSSSAEVALDALLSAYVTTASSSGYLDEVPKALDKVLRFIRAEQNERTAPSHSPSIH